MKVKCKYNKINQISDKAIQAEIRSYIHGICDDSEIGLEVGKIYDVYGISCMNNVPKYFICQYPDDLYPIADHVAFFEVIQPDIPHNWQFSYQSNQDYYIVPKEWAQTKNFYENLLNSAPKEQAIFLKIKEQHKSK